MNKDAFKKTMIEVLKSDKISKDVRDRDQLIKMLDRARVNFVPQYAFANHGRSSQRWEIIELRFPVPLLGTAEEHMKELDSLVKYVYEESADYALDRMEIKPQVVDTPEEVTEHDVVFDEIQNTLIQGIRDAKFIIWAAIAWFTNDAIYKELVAKKNQGLNVRIVVSQEDSNKSMISKLEENGFDVKVIPKSGYYGCNRMHDKFCIVDMDYVMHGSYNWTLAANYNEETLATALDHELVTKFATEFMELYNGI